VKQSFYTLEIFVEPGGARMSWRLVSNNWEHVQKALKSYFQEDEQHPSLYLLLWYGTSIFTQTYQNGVRTQKIDLLPFIQVKIHGFEAFWVTDWQRMTNLQVENSNDTIEKPDDGELFFNSKNNDMEWNWNILIDWGNIDVERLSGNILKKRSRVIMYSNYTGQETRVSYGIYETEEGWYQRNIDWDSIWDIAEAEDDEGWDEVDEQMYQQHVTAAKERDMQEQLFKRLLHKVDEYSNNYAYAQAIQVIHELLRIGDVYFFYFDRLLVLNNRAYYYHRLGQNEIALQEIEALLQTNPDFAIAHHTKAEILVALKQYPEALISIHKAIEIEPSVNKEIYKSEILKAMND
jgi:tetratricopeptide (TPR) repeat protein